MLTGMAYAQSAGVTQSSTLAANAATAFSAAAQAVTLSAQVSSPSGTVNDGTVTFQIMNGTVAVGSAATSGTVTAGAANVSYTLPAGTPLGTYVIAATYSGGPHYPPSSDSTHTLTVLQVSATAAANASAVYSTSSQLVALSAAVTATSGSVNEGTVTFQIKNGNANVGSAITSATLTSNGNAGVSYTLPAGTAVGTYTIQALYSGGVHFLASSDTSHSLTVMQAPVSVAAANATVVYSLSSQNAALNAAVTSPGGTVSEGTVTFQLKSGNVNIGTALVAVTSNGNAGGSYVLPAGTAAGTYTIAAVYSGTNFAAGSDTTHSLAISQASAVALGLDATAAYASLNQNVTLNAAVFSPSGIVQEGSMTFQVNNGAVASSPVVDGGASVAYVLPGGTPVGSYSIAVSYSGTNFTASSDSAHRLTVSQAATTTTAANSIAMFSAAVQNVTLNAAVASPGGAVNLGSVTFQVKNGTSNVGSAVTSATVANGAADVAYALPAGTPAGTYTLVDLRRQPELLRQQRQYAHADGQSGNAGHNLVRARRHHLRHRAVHDTAQRGGQRSDFRNVGAGDVRVRARFWNRSCSGPGANAERCIFSER
jgi:hypothetical protein